MSRWRSIEQPGGGVAVVIPSAVGAPSAKVAPAGAPPMRVTALLSDHGLARQEAGAPANAFIAVRSGDESATGLPLETSPISIAGALDIEVSLASSERAAPIRMSARLDEEAGALLPGPCYLAMFPSEPPVDVDRLSVIDGRLRLGGAPMDQLDYALVRLVGTARLDLAAMRDLEELREGLLATYQAGDDAESERALRAAIDAIRAHPRLHAADRERLAGALRREWRAWDRSPFESMPSGPVDWPEFVAGLSPALEGRGWTSAEPPDAGAEPPGAGAEPPTPDAVPAPKPVHWNTRVLDGERALDELFVTVGRAYTIETGLDPVPLADALVSSTIAPAGLPDGTKVTFEVSCPQPILRGHGDAAGEPVARVSHTGTYEAATGRCPPARFGLVPAARGRIPLTLNVVTDNAIRASTLLTLQAELAALQPVEPAHSPSLAGEQPPAALAASPPLPPPSPPLPPPRPTSSLRPIDISPAALTGPPAQLRFELTATNQIVISDGVVTEKPRDPSARWGVLIGEAIRARAALVELSHAYRRAAAPASELALADAPALRLRMAKIGAALHKAFFGKPGDRVTDLDVQNLAKTIADTPAPGAAARLQIVAAFQPFPWAVFYDGAYRGKPLTDDPASVDLACFWGHRFRIDRMIMGHVSAARAPTLPAPVRVQACLNRHLDDEPAAKALGVKVIERQRALFDGLPGVAVQPRIESTDGFVAFLKSATAACDLLYVFCHATAAVTKDELFTYSDKAPDTQAKLIFDPPPAAPVDVRAMQDAREPLLNDRPLVFLNACSSAAGDELFQSPMLEQFLERWGAIGVLGTDWEVPTVFADAFARRLLDHFLRGRTPLGEAFWLASHEAFAEGNPFPLVYALYARPDLTTMTNTTTTASRGGLEP